MKIPVWKKYLSYIKDIHIESRSSEYNEDIYVDLSQGRFRLLTPDAIYSHEDLYDNFGQLFKKDLLLKEMDISKVLVLGLGLGSIPIILDQVMPGQWDITAVEIDEEITDLAYTYGMNRISSPIQVITADAEMFVNITSEKYALICVDLFIGDKTPDQFKRKPFLKKLKSLLEENGLIIYNTLAYNKTDKKISSDFFKSVYKEVFPEALSIYSHRNNMLISHGHWLRNKHALFLQKNKSQ